MSVVVVGSGLTSTFQFIVAGETVEVQSGGTLLAGDLDPGGEIVISAGGSGSGTDAFGNELVFGTVLATVVDEIIGGSGTIGGTQTIEAGGAASDTNVLGAAVQVVASGGMAVSSFFGVGGTQIVQAGGSASGTDIQQGSQTIEGLALADDVDGGSAVVLSGGVASGALLLNGAMTVSSGADVTGVQVNDALLTVARGGTVSAAELGWSGTLEVSAGGTLDGAVIGGGTLILSSGAVASGVAFQVSGGEIVLGGTLATAISGAVYGDTLDLAGLAWKTGASAHFLSGNVLAVSAGGTVVDVAFNPAETLHLAPMVASDGSGGTLVTLAPAPFSDTIGSGQHSSGLTVVAGETLTVAAGGRLRASTVQTSGSVVVAGLAEALTVSSLGAVDVLAGGTLIGATVVSAGSLQVAGLLAGSVVGGLVYLLSGGHDRETVLSGVEYVSSGAMAVRDSMSKDGSQIVLAGGTVSATLISGVAPSENVVQFVRPGGVAMRDTVEGFGTVWDTGGVLNGLLLHGEFAAVVMSGGSAVAPVIDQGSFYMSGGTVTDAKVSGPGFAISAGSVAGLRLTGQGDAAILGHALASDVTAGPGTMLAVWPGGTVDGLRIEGATITLDAGAAGSGFDFVGIGATLVMAGSVDPIPALSGFGRGDTIDLYSFIWSKGESATLSAGTLEVVSAGRSIDIALDPARSYADFFPALSSASTLFGTVVTLVPETGNIVSAGQTLDVPSGETLTGTKVLSGGLLVAESGVASGTHVLNGGTATALGGGMLRGTVVGSGGEDLVQPGGSAAGTVVSGPGVEAASSGGVASGTRLLAGGTQLLIAGGVASGTHVSSGGAVVVNSGGMASGTLLSSLGSEMVFPDGRAVDTVVLALGQEMLYGGVATGTRVLSAGVQSVGNILVQGDVASDTTVFSGGRQVVAPGDAAIGTKVSAGGLLDVQANFIVSTGGGGTISGATVRSGGSVEVAGGSADGVRIFGGGVLAMDDGAVGSGLAFVGSGGSLVLGGSTDTAGALRGLGAGDMVDLTGLHFAAGASARFVSGPALVVQAGGVVFDLALEPSHVLYGLIASVTADASGGSLVTFSAAMPQGGAVLDAPVASAAVAFVRG